MTNSGNGIQREIKVKGQNLEQGQASNILAQLIHINCLSHRSSDKAEANMKRSLGSKVKLMRFFVISIFQYACESLTLTGKLEKRTQTFKMRCYRRLVNISYKGRVTNKKVRRRIQAATGKSYELLTLV